MKTSSRHGESTPPLRDLDPVRCSPLAAGVEAGVQWRVQSKDNDQRNTQKYVLIRSLWRTILNVAADVKLNI